tara:strand:+ start:113 stop:556 length:444 start_codon:yes stop_codon:yes gene_type:complete
MAIYFDSETTDSLQHYEEGTFTLTLSKSDGSGETSGGTANYTRIGRWVNCWGQITFGNAAASVGGSHCYIKGWPFYYGSYSSNDIVVNFWNNGSDIYEDGYPSVSGSTTTNVWGLYIHKYNGAPSISGSQMGNGGRLSIDFSYEITN